MNDEPIVEYLRSRGAVEVPGGFMASVMDAIQDAPAAPNRFEPYLPAFVAVGATVVLVAAGLVFGQRALGPAPSPSERGSVATVDEVRSAVSAAVSVLRSAEGVEGTGTYHVFDELGSASWFSWRPSGDQVVVNRSDVDVTETGWWRDPASEPPARGLSIQTSIQVLVGRNYYFTRGDVAPDEWVSGIRRGSPAVLGIPFPAALDGRMDPWQGEFAWALDGEASIMRLPDGAERWTVTSPVRDGSLVQEFYVGPDGALRSMSQELVGTEPTLDERPFTSGFIELTILEDPQPIPEPGTDTPPDPGVFGLPDEFPLD
jgi:hypothetical protein